MRRVAAEVGCSTTVLYTLFGGKDGLAAGLYREGFVRLRRRLDASPPEPDPVRRLYVLGAAYRDSALADPHLYRVMFLGAIPGFVPDADARAGADAAFAPLIDAARESIEAGLLRPGDPSAVAEVLWAAAHGVVSLELAGLLPASGERFAAATHAAVAWFLPPGGAAGPVDGEVAPLP
jgi:AcrR family transcriptional regulator